MKEHLVHLEGVARTFGSGLRSVVAVHEVSADVFAGDRICVVGRSGSGKSTLLGLMSGLDSPDHGVIAWPNLEADPKGDPFLVGTVFQVPSLVPVLTAVENVALPLVLHGSSEAEAGDLALTALESVGLAQVAHQLPDELSSGQQQRVTVARVLTTRPRLILADEPTGRLDHRTGHHVITTLVEAAEAIDAALVVATHDPAVFERFPIRWRMRDGSLAVPTAIG